MTPEAKVKNDIKKWLKTHNLNGSKTWFFMPVSNGMGSMGIPDIIACVGGIMVGIECKAPGKKGTVTKLQQHQLDGIIGAGGCAIVADCVEDVVHALIMHKIKM